MGKKKGRRPSEEERISMNSTGILHGQVDFFAPTKRKQKYVDRKLKVLQTWIFIQALALVVMTAYLILMTVWLSPYFPMNDQSSSDDNDTVTAAEMSQLQTALDNVSGAVNEDVKQVDRIQEWRKDFMANYRKLNDAVQKQQIDIENLQNQVGNLENKSKQQAAASQSYRRRASMDQRNNEVFKREVNNKLSSLQTELAKQEASFIKQLECLRDTVEDGIYKLSNSTKDRFDEVNAHLAKIQGEVSNMQTQVKDHIQETGLRIQKLNEGWNNLNNTIHDMETKQIRIENNFAYFKKNYSVWKEEIDRVNHQTQEEITCQTNRITQVETKQRDNLAWVKDSLATERNLTQGEVGALQRETQAEIGRMKCSVEELQENLNTTENQFTTALNGAMTGLQKEMGRITRGLERQMNEKRQSLGILVTHQMQNLTSEIETEATNRKEDIERVTGNINAVRGNLMVLEGTVKDHKNESDENIMELRSKIDLFNQTQVQLGIEMPELRSDLAAANDRITNVEGNCTEQYDSLLGGQYTMNLELKNLEDNHTCLTQRVANLENTTNNMEDTIQRNDNSARMILREHEAKTGKNIQELEENLKTLAPQVGNNTDDITRLSATLATLNSTVNSEIFDLTNPGGLKTRVVELKGTVAGLSNCCEYFPEEPPVGEGEGER